MGSWNLKSISFSRDFGSPYEFTDNMPREVVVLIRNMLFGTEIKTFKYFHAEMTRLK